MADLVPARSLDHLRPPTADLFAAIDAFTQRQLGRPLPTGFRRVFAPKPVKVEITAPRDLVRFATAIDEINALEEFAFSADFLGVYKSLHDKVARGGALTRHPSIPRLATHPLVEMRNLAGDVLMAAAHAVQVVEYPTIRPLILRARVPGMRKSAPLDLAVFRLDPRKPIHEPTIEKIRMALGVSPHADHDWQRQQLTELPKHHAQLEELALVAMHAAEPDAVEKVLTQASARVQETLTIGSLAQAVAASHDSFNLGG